MLMPGPLSRTESSPGTTRSSISPSGGLHLTALSSRFEIARSTRASTARTPHGSSSVCTVTLGLRTRTRSASSRGEQVEAKDARGLVLVLGVAREVDEVADQPGQLLELLDDVGEQRLALVIEIRSAWASTSMLVRMLAIGVRSSCEASATSWRWAPSELVERLEHLVEAARKRGKLVLAAGLDPAAQVAGRGDLLGRPAQLLDRGDCGPRDEVAEAAAEDDPAHACEREDQRELAEIGVDLAERARDLDRLALGRAVPCRRAGGAPRSPSRCRTARGRRRQPSWPPLTLPRSVRGPLG